ncbi:hypothetical protein DFH08DRAFT_794597, partial [Mycena albidolilacea]
ESFTGSILRARLRRGLLLGPCPPRTRLKSPSPRVSSSPRHQRPTENRHRLRHRLHQQPLTRSPHTLSLPLFPLLQKKADVYQSWEWK